ncbi:MAG: AsmA-like C-terminal region-containing protein, partial [Bacteroidales bacterium]
SSLLASDMMPVMQTVEGYGKLHSDNIQLVESKVFDKMKEVLKLGDKYSNTFRDVNVSFKITEGRVYVNPFDVKLGNMKMNISGDQGLDQTLNYIIKTEIPRADLGGAVNSLIDNLTSQAQSFGLNYKPADVLKVPVKVGGTFSKPEVSPYFGSGKSSPSDGGEKSTVKETVKQTVEGAKETGKEKLREEAAVRGDQLIKEAEEQGQRLRDEAAKAAAKLKAQADSSAVKLIKAADSKGALAKLGAQKSGDALKKEADKKGAQLILEADNQARKLVEEAKAKKEEMINKI